VFAFAIQGASDTVLPGGSSAGPLKEVPPAIPAFDCGVTESLLEKIGRIGCFRHEGREKWSRDWRLSQTHDDIHH
jgi:hypothetical protein